ncbi:hypothetical protein TSUD_82510 [Trifolium subterraneum]|uniref:Isoflavone 2'-hydroxylase n=1 Tax=Trifolium subterraneum TaxID=3900 RepID=A0A2Z6MER0_TRISU|nr:hypothetical protein TSUD_82510 [Trifolium subterraneum]
MGVLSFFFYSLFYLSIFFIIRLLFQSRKFKNLPPGPNSLPIIGDLHHLKRPLHRTFKGLTKKYGNVISLWFGSRLVVVVSSLSEFQQCFTKNDVVLANRPKFLSGKYIFYNYTTLGSTAYGEHWRNLRRITSLDVLSNHRINNFAGIRKDETQRMITKLAEDSSTDFAEVELTFRFFDMTFNNIMRMISGKRYYGEDCDMSDLQEASQFRDMVAQLLQLSGANNKTDFLPVLKFLDFENLEKRVKYIGGKCDEFLSGLLEEQRNKKERTNTMIDHLLNMQESQPEYYTDQIIKGLALVTTTFKPERFEKKGELEKMIAFGMGRRACPGEALAMRAISMTLALLVQCFDWKLTGDGKIDMTERDGFTLTKLVPLKAMCKTRPVVNKLLIK